MGGTFVEKIVVVTQKTAMEELAERFNTRQQSKFYVEQMGVSFAEYENADDTYRQAVERLKIALPRKVRQQWIERGFLPNFLFGQRDLVIALGRDGLVVNVAKYLRDQPLMGVNPDPIRNVGVLLPFDLAGVGMDIEKALYGDFPGWNVTMAQADLNDGQSIVAVNDLFIGRKSHISARYHIRHGNREEVQSSSGILVTTGAGSTGWYHSLMTGAMALTGQGNPEPTWQFGREAKLLKFGVREPYPSGTTGAGVVGGEIRPGQELVITSQMPQDGVIFSDGIESDFLTFNTGSVAKIRIADRTLRLARREARKPHGHR